MAVARLDHRRRRVTGQLRYRKKVDPCQDLVGDGRVTDIVKTEVLQSCRSLGPVEGRLHVSARPILLVARKNPFRLRVLAPPIEHFLDGRGHWDHVRLALLGLGQEDVAVFLVVVSAPEPKDFATPPSRVERNEQCLRDSDGVGKRAAGCLRLRGYRAPAKALEVCEYT